MLELACFAAGVLAAWLALTLRQRRAPTPAAGAAAAPAAANAPRALQRPPVAPDARALAVSLAEQLANLGSCVEGRAHQLIEVAPDRAKLPNAAETLLAAVAKLRTLHAKLVAFGHVHRAPDGERSAALPQLLARLRGELQQMHLGLELRWDPGADLPCIAVHPDVARDALLFLCGAMLRAERGATHLAIASEPCFASPEPAVQLELSLEWRSDSPTPASEPLADPAFTLDLEAANQLITSYGGDLTLTHLPGRSVCAVVRWPIAARVEPAGRLAEVAASPAREPVPAVPAAAAPAPGPLAFAEPHVTADAAAADVRGDGAGEPEPATSEAGSGEVSAAADAGDGAQHQYGGALVLESDPSVRAMLASELKATGRAVFACADGASARTFLEATPDRFELLIIDHPQRLDGGDALAATIRAVAPGLKIFVLATGRPPPTESWAQVHHIEKPFGLHELRRALASILAAG